MNRRRWSHVRRVFERSLELDAAARAAYLDEACRNAAAVRTEVERLLREDDGAADFLAVPVGRAPGAAPDETPPLAPGSRLGTFRVGRVIATGGMGTVHEAVQDEPRRTVALKTIRHGLSTPARRRRFLFEAEVLGRLHHPGIAQVYASGTHELRGRSFPYFAMEYVEGAQDLFTHADERGLDRRERLELFLRVCDAMRYAHAKGVIHRDLKGGNVLVDASGNPKVIDFGIARVASEAAEPRGLPILALGTPSTMSPEHASGRPEDVDVRSDVYSLGCVLHELLAGRPPRDLDGLPTAEVVRRIREVPPDVAAELPSELRWIVTRALAPRPERRYAGVAELEADLRRHLTGELVEAVPPGNAYRLGKLVRRHRLPLIAAAGVLAALAFGLVRSEGARRETAAALERAERAERAARDRALAAERASARAGETLAFFERTVEDVAPLDGGRTVLLADVLARMASAAEAELADREELEAAIRASVGRALKSIGRLDEAEPHLERALGLRERLASGAAETARSRHDLGALRQDQGRLDDAERLLRSALRAWEEVGAAPDTEAGARLATLNRLATVHQQKGELDEAAAFLERALALAARTRTPEDREVLMTRANLAMVLRDQGRAEEGVALLRDVVETSRRARGADHPDTVLWVLHLAAVLVDAGGLDEAAALTAATRDKALETFGDDHPYALKIQSMLGYLRYHQHRFEEAAAAMAQLLGRQERVLGEAHPDALQTLHNLGMAKFAAGAANEAEALLRRSLARHRAAGLFGCQRTLDDIDTIAEILDGSGRRDEAVRLLEAARAEVAVEGKEDGGPAARFLSERLETLQERSLRQD